MQTQQRRVADNEPSVTMCNLLQSISETSLKIAAPTPPTVVSTILSKH